MTLVADSQSDQETRALARRLAGLVRPGDLILLAGGLGTGKTAFAAGLAEGLGVPEAVTSPTFVLVRRYEGGFLPFVHADLYRVASRAELEDLDLFEEAREGVLVVEWGHAVEKVMPPDHLLVDLKTTGPTGRRIRLVPRGSWVARALQEVVG